MVVGEGSGRPNVAGLWIDYVLLPERLDEHLGGLASGAVTTPSYAELVNMFLEQAVANHKITRKETDSQDTPSNDSPSRIASVLCERSVKVALAGEFTLADIETLVARHLQSLLLKALMKYDKVRSLVHQCNFHRWVIHKALVAEPVGFAAPNALRSGVRNVADESSDILKDSILPVEGLDSGVEPSVAFLENVLEKEKVMSKVSKGQVNQNGDEKIKKKVTQNGLINDGGLKEDHLCQLLFDVAEAHFMRGRMKRAHELFSKCGYLVSGSSGSCPVPQDRLNGFIVACRSLTRSSDAVLDTGVVLDQQHVQDAEVGPTLTVPGEEAVFACERSRLFIKRKNYPMSSCNGVHEAAGKKRNESKTVIKENGVKFQTQEHSKPFPDVNGYDIRKPKLRLDIENSDFASSVEDKDLLEVMADDVLKHDLSWSYCLSLERDASLPPLVRCKLAACNALRSVLEGASFDSFLQVSEQFEDNSDTMKATMEFLIQLMSKMIYRIRADGLSQDGGTDGTQVLRVQQFCNYVCCVIEESWCWKLAIQLGVLSAESVPKLRGPFRDTFPGQTGVKAVGDRESSGSVLLDVLQADNVTTIETVTTQMCGQPPEGIARIVQMRAFDALEKAKDIKLAKHFYDLAKRIHPGDINSDLFLWYLDMTSSGDKEHKCRASLPEKCEGYSYPSFGVLEYVSVKLIDVDRWSLLLELSQWAQRRHSGKKELGFILKEAAILSNLMPLCSKFQEAARRNHSNDEVARLTTTLWQTFEELMCLFLSTKDDDQVLPSCVVPSDSLELGLKILPIISKVSNVNTLKALACLAAGWLHRCHATAAAPLELARYGIIAEVTAAAVVPATISNPNSQSVKAAIDCGKNLFGILLERLLKLDKDKGSQWLLGLADLAFMDEAYLKALQLYLQCFPMVVSITGKSFHIISLLTSEGCGMSPGRLWLLQAGAVRSSFYCDRMSSMARQFFTPWVIARMIAASKEIGARLQAVILCQCLPEPDYESAFQILQANPLIVDKDAASYFDCVWEIPILELLVHMHAKAGDRARVSTLVSLLQQPALNVHNPASIRQAHIVATEQRFLQRFYAELV